jgi:hypothetical protein
MGTFGTSVKRFVEATKQDADEACRAIGISLLTKIVLRSPVGNPELWKANQGAVYGRETFNLFADALNAGDAAAGSRRKPLRRKGQRALANQFPLRAGKGYVGGRFRGSWQVTFDAASTAVPTRIDPAGGATISEGTATLANFKAGPSIHITSNLPYSIPLEFGHSTQAPMGVVRITIMEFEEIVNQAAAQVAAK